MPKHKNLKWGQFWRVAGGESEFPRASGNSLDFPEFHPTSLEVPRRLSQNFCREKLYQKNPRVRKIFVRNSGAGNGCANLMDAWKKSVRSAGKAMSVKFSCFRGGGYFGFWGGGAGECRFYFYGREDFSENKPKFLF